MAVVYGKEENVAGDRGIMTKDHPVIELDVLLKTKTQKLKAGTILKKSATTGKYEPAADADTPACVLTEDSDGTTGLQRAAFHGVAVRSRLVDASGETAVKASDTLAAKLPAIGIWVTQAYDGEVA